MGIYLFIKCIEKQRVFFLLMKEFALEPQPVCIVTSSSKYNISAAIQEEELPSAYFELVLQEHLPKVTEVPGLHLLHSCDDVCPAGTS